MSPILPRAGSFEKSEAVTRTPAEVFLVDGSIAGLLRLKWPVRHSRQHEVPRPVQHNGLLRSQ